MSANFSVEQSLMKAKSHTKKGELVEAQKLFQSVLIAFPKNTRAQQGLATLNKNNITQSPPQEAVDQLVNLYNQGQIASVIEQAEVLTDQYPGAAVVWNILGASRAQVGKLDEAIDAYKKTISLKPGYADAYFNMGIVLKDQGKFEEAIQAYKKSITLKPDHAEAYCNMGDILHNQARPDEAIESHKKAISLKPDYADAYNNMGVALRSQGKLEESLEAYKKSISLKPNYAEAYNNMGITLKNQGMLEEAIDAFKKCILLKPDFAEAYNNMGNALNDQGKLEEATKNFNKALSLKTDFVDAYYNNSFSYNLKGNLQEGLKLYEWRLKRKCFPTKPARKNLIWDGKKSVSGKDFLVYEEQGLGDIIQFCRYLPLLKQKGAEVTFKVNQKMHALLHTIANDIVLVDSYLDDNKVDFEVPLMSLPFLFNTNLDTIPSGIPYLFADDDKVTSWGKRLSKATFKVGICWQGSKNKIDFGRSFPLSFFRGISELPNVELISLHKGEGEEQIKDVNFELTTLGDNFDAGEDAFIDTAAVMKNCDLIITSDTATAHLAGALGCHTWVALKKVPDWRWMLDRNDSPWYQNMTLYRQTERGNWKYIFDTMQTDLLALLKQEKRIK